MTWQSGGSFVVMVSYMFHVVTQCHDAGDSGVAFGKELRDGHALLDANATFGTVATKGGPV